MPEIEKRKDIQNELELLRHAAREAGRIAMRYFGQSPEVWFKEGQSPVSEADFAVDTYLKQVLLEARPDYGWISEETTDDRTLQHRRRAFVVDPIDGTRAFIGGQSQWCVSVAVVEDGKPIAGVLQCPVLSEVIEAGKGFGASQNGLPIQTRLPPPGEKISMASAKRMVDVLPDGWRDRVIVHPYVPSLAYRIAMVARGDIAGTFIRPNSHDWDLAAADLILSESGGALLGHDARPIIYGGPTLQHGALVASSGNLLQEMLSVVADWPLS
ncbi:3'(2'),5'-bisphosphate nucleotidase CysQ [Ochrobactrum sp. Marseille-Q0166]|uniref:3'(2'),5'-bisphosphate nucleotidase CysQ n=1 Tax=Ochrobactrum sp. Marseille-Q0166 TaxID=2761105 RepID=UPI001655965F|nr:3'(2'),5'-bisphosphate nucleotidase CysQ [Ochrobactrum sp. Marseille-Q0166]MBC8718353.1 3'(2'),5'-bisphosphate nucleotidase CysQ [Ochrobactrum sp. Marseille-Q0166]